MTQPGPGQTVHMMNGLDVLRVVVGLHLKEGRNVRELALYTTDDLRRLYQERKGDIIDLADGIIDRVQLVAVIRWRVWWSSWGTGLVLVAAVASAFFAFMAWRFPVPPPRH